MISIYSSLRERISGWRNFRRICFSSSSTMLRQTGSPVIAFKAVPAAMIQLGGYGCGFIRAYFLKIICGKGRDEAEEVAMRKGK